MSHQERQYLDLLQKILISGSERLDRTGVGTKAVFGAMMRFDLSQGFPLFTTKKVFWKTAFKEMLWMLSGSTSLRALLSQNVRIWTDWPLQRFRKETGLNMPQDDFERLILIDDAFNEKWGDLGPIYGAQWRAWQAADGRKIDQVQDVIDTIKKNPASRRIIIEGWNVGELHKMALPPCHKTYQFFVRENERKLDLLFSMRSCDTAIGLPFNIANAALMLTLMALETGLEPGELVWSGADAHIYSNHFAGVRKLIEREPKAFPKLVVRKKPSLFEYTIEDFEIEGYEPHPPIAFDVAV